MDPIVVAPHVLALILGACVGSFLNVVVYRLPAGESLLSPPSHCPKCNARLRWFENVPVLGWLRLRGKCAHCGAPIAVRYPLVEAGTALLFLLSSLTFGSSLMTLAGFCLLSWLVALSLIDLDTMTLPNPLTQSGLVAGLVFQAVSGWGDSRQLLTQVATGIFGAVLGLWLFELINWLGTLWLGQTAMGAGDAKLSAMLGAWLGWQLLLLTAFMACAIGALIGVGGVALGLLSRRQPMPFGPFLALGGALSWFIGPRLLALYLNWVGLQPG
ncbi:A24 family peptidase [Leptolyngbya sp. FACHB-261]|uniref:prepilin peptidase n=1 Tax=Leptolyngbya sp. FACHB-261 TaxID=2692806 RepID=UPI0016832207|nr:A24 family peptidase [Leptolyngbya sp. FACHB-261]MBD2100492.1 prepilin peptidase [Leptolyngbya sp. FACHB-261]